MDTEVPMPNVERISTVPECWVRIPPDHRKAQSRPLLLSGIERLENVRHVGLGNPCAVVAHGNGRAGVATLPEHVDGAAVRHRFASVLDKVEQAMA